MIILQLPPIITRITNITNTISLLQRRSINTAILTTSQHLLLFLLVYPYVCQPFPVYSHKLDGGDCALGVRGESEGPRAILGDPRVDLFVLEYSVGEQVITYLLLRREIRWCQVIFNFCYNHDFFMNLKNIRFTLKIYWIVKKGLMTLVLLSYSKIES